MRGFPVVAEAGFLHHGEEFVVGEGAGRGQNLERRWRLVPGDIDGSDFVGRGFAADAEEVFVAGAIASLDADRGVRLAVVGAEYFVVLQGRVGDRSPAQVDVAVIAFRGHARRCCGRVGAGGRVGGDFDVVEVERVGLAVVEALHEGDADEFLRVELLVLGVVDLADERVERQANARPFSRRNLRERAGELDRRCAFTVRVSQVDAWGCFCRKIFFGVAPYE